MEEIDEIPQTLLSGLTQDQNLIQLNQNQEEQENNLLQEIQTHQVPQLNIEEAQKQQEPLPQEDQKAIMDKKKVEKLYLEIKALIAFKMSKDDKVPAEIIENLYLGSIGSALSKKMLLELKITHVVTAMDKMKNAFDDCFKYKAIKLADTQTQNVKMYFEESNKFIHEVLESKQKVLVHCFAGKSRSTTLIIAYLICYKKMTRDEALAFIKQKRPIAQPNMNFMRQLLEYECEIFKKDINRQQNESEGKKSDHILEVAIEEKKELDPLSSQEIQIKDDQQNEEDIIKVENSQIIEQLQNNLENVIQQDQVDQLIDSSQEQKQELEPQFIQQIEKKEEQQELQQIEKSEEQQLNLDQQEKEEIKGDLVQPNDQDKE